jgi:hypothetical protein
MADKHQNQFLEVVNEQDYSTNQAHEPILAEEDVAMSADADGQIY